MSRDITAPEVTFHQTRLPLTMLHYVKSGAGPPLVMVPATISEVKNWLPLVQFMGQRFTSYFFELPGHGKSTPFPVPFSSELIGAMLEEFLDKMGISSVWMMGFSFGGILTLKALHHLKNRIQKVILVSPYLGKQTLRFSNLHLWSVRKMALIFQSPFIRQNLVNLLDNELIGDQLLRRVQRISKVEDTIPLEKRLREIPTSTFDVLAYQLDEILNSDFPPPETPFTQPCYFAMSVHDPLLDFDVTLSLLQRNFSQVYVQQFITPYHQLPQPLTFESLVRDYGHFLDIVQ